MLFREREPVGPQSIGRGVGEALTRLSAHIGVLPAERRAGFEQVVAQARAAMADQHVEFAQALTSVLEA
ncbi:MAG: hypothetical protein KGM44_10160, partial [bacterium]|nr:hypothetical protein [bacterium]